MSKIKSICEGWEWLLATVVLSLMLVTLTSPGQLSLLLWTMVKITVGAYLGMLINKTMLKTLGGDDEYDDGALYRKTAVVCATILGATIGL